MIRIIVILMMLSTSVYAFGPKPFYPQQPVLSGDYYGDQTAMHQYNDDVERYHEQVDVYNERQREQEEFDHRMDDLLHDASRKWLED